MVGGDRRHSGLDSGGPTSDGDDDGDDGADGGLAWAAVWGEEVAAMVQKENQIKRMKCPLQHALREK
jgi:hypothetical protein